MEKRDNRKLSPEGQYKLRKQVVQLRMNGKSNQEISEIVGLCYSHISTIWQKYQKGGGRLLVLKPRVRGRRLGARRKLTVDQETMIIKFLVDKTPAQLKLHFNLWTRDAIRLAIKLKFGVGVPLSTVTDYLQRWGFRPQKPTKSADEQNPKKFKRWLDFDYPDILAKSKEEKAEIHWGNDTGGKKGVRLEKGFFGGMVPIVTHSINENSVNMLSSITNQGKARFMLYRGTMTTQIFIKFLSRLIHDCNRKVFLLLYDHQAHHSNFVDDWLKTRVELIELHYLPSNLPEHNPIEIPAHETKRRKGAFVMSKKSALDLIKNKRSSK